MPKQNAFWEEKKKTDEGYDPTQKYRLVWDVMTHNMNQLIDKGGLDLTLDERDYMAKLKLCCNCQTPHVPESLTTR